MDCTMKIWRRFVARDQKLTSNMALYKTAINVRTPRTHVSARLTRLLCCRVVSDIMGLGWMTEQMAISPGRPSLMTTLPLSRKYRGKTVSTLPNAIGALRWLFNSADSMKLGCIAAGVLSGKCQSAGMWVIFLLSSYDRKAYSIAAPSYD